MENSKVALIDLDGTTANYDKAMLEALSKIGAPGEQVDPSMFHDHAAPHIVARQKLIRNAPGFWRNLERIELGFKVVQWMREIGYTLHVLTKGPRSSQNAWTEKAQWTVDNIPDAAITVTSDKSLVYGTVLFDDFPPYFMGWLENRSRGLVVCLDHPHNRDIVHPNVVRYDGTNDDRIKEVLLKAYNRPSGESVNY